MSNKDREGMSKREQMRARRRQAEARARLLWIAGIILIAAAAAFFVIYPQLKPVAAVQPAPTAEARPQVDRNSTGDPNAPVKMVEFSDFQCPFCKKFWQDTEPQIIDAYVKTGKVLFTYRSAGNWVSRGRGGVESQNAAMAAYCAADQNKFWEMHDALFTNLIGEDVGSFTPRRLELIAGTIGLDVSAFNSCFSGNKYKNQADQDYNDAIASGMRGTPFFVITYTVNGQTQTATVDGAQPFRVFQQEIDKALAAAGK